MAMQADWIAMLDDDETADRNWIEQLMAPEYRGSPVLCGRQILIYPDPKPFWAQDEEARAPDEGAQLRTSTTTNIRFSIDLPRAGLRFDESFGLHGGEDRDFFGRAHDSGFLIRFTRRAITWEVVHPSRATFWGQMHRALWSAAAAQRREILKKGTGPFGTRKCCADRQGAGHRSLATAMGGVRLAIRRGALQTACAARRAKSGAGHRSGGCAAWRHAASPIARSPATELNLPHLNTESRGGIPHPAHRSIGLPHNDGGYRDQLPYSRSPVKFSRSWKMLTKLR